MSLRVEKPPRLTPLPEIAMPMKIGADTTNRKRIKARMIPLHAKRGLRFAERIASIAPSPARHGKPRDSHLATQAMSDLPTPRVSGWAKYYAATEGRPPRPTLLFALDRFAAEGVRGTAADLG